MRWDAAVAAGSGRCAAAHTIAVATRLFVLGLSLLFSRHVDAKISVFATKVRMAVRVCGGAFKVEPPKSEMGNQAQHERVQSLTHDAYLS